MSQEKEIKKEQEAVEEALKENENIILIPRVQYFDFMKLLENAKFVITDGGSNQEELYYMQKPCLILRKVTERKEGIGRIIKQLILLFILLMQMKMLQ